MNIITRIIKIFIYSIGIMFSGLCTSKSLRKKIRTIFDLDRKNSTRSLFINHRKQGKIYTPIYTGCYESPSCGAEIYNKYGNKLETFFLRGGYENMIDNVPTSKYFVWDRYNFNLDVQFYLHNAMLETMGNPKKRYGLFIESESIAPSSYRIFEQNKGIEKDFDMIFTHTEKLLDKYDNARLLPYCARIWYSLKDPHSLEGEPDPNWYEYKTKNISIVSSDKKMCKLHHLRLNWAKQCKQNGWADTFGNFDGGDLIDIGDSLKNYRYSIAIENEIEPYWFTEKVVNCFASMTIPVYVGATKIDEFFNPDGIIQVHPKDYDNLEKIVKMCTEKEYDMRINAVKENYYKSLQFENINDYMYEKYLQTDLRGT